MNHKVTTLPRKRLFDIREDRLLERPLQHRRGVLPLPGRFARCTWQNRYPRAEVKVWLAAVLVVLALFISQGSL